MNVLFLTGRMPDSGKPGTLAPVARQIHSIVSYLESYSILEITGPAFLKYIHAGRGLKNISSQYDLIHAHYGLSGLPAITATGLPLVLSLMGSDIQFSPDSPGLGGKVRAYLEHRLSRFAAKRADRIIVKSAKMAEAVAPMKSIVIPNGVDLDTFRPLPKDKAKKALNIHTEKKLILFGGNPADMNKNYSLAQKAIETAGEVLGETLECMPLAGYIPEKVPYLMNSCECMIFTSIQEGSPNVVKEALACNLPVVSVNVGDTPFLLRGVSGCSLCPYDHIELGTAIADILLEGKSSDGRESLLRKKLDSESVAKEIVSIYRDVLSSTPSP